MKSIIIFVICVLACLVYAGVRIVASVQFDRGCEGHLKRAADSNTIELATKELDTAVAYMQTNNLTSGYTSVLYTTPDEDITFWYSNISASLNELQKVKTNAPQLEKSNVLMKLRETLLDEGKATNITVPQGISLYPTNTFWAIIGVLALLGGLSSIILFLVENG